MVQTLERLRKHIGVILSDEHTLNTGIVLLSPNLGFGMIPRKYCVYSEDWKDEAAEIDSCDES